MGISYNSICEKLGFDALSWEPVHTEWIDDSIENPFSVLTEEESEFLTDYAMKNRK